MYIIVHIVIVVIIIIIYIVKASFIKVVLDGQQHSPEGDSRDPSEL